MRWNFSSIPWMQCCSKWASWKFRCETVFCLSWWSILIFHDDVIKWKHFPRYWPFIAGNSPVTGEFPSQRPVTRSFDVLFDARLNKLLSKQSWGWWLETSSGPLWRHCNAKISKNWFWFDGNSQCHQTNTSQCRIIASQGGVLLL